jgi:hypothetical protein
MRPSKSSQNLGGRTLRRTKWPKSNAKDSAPDDRRLFASCLGKKGGKENFNRVLRKTK